MEQNKTAPDNRTAANDAEVCAIQELVYNGRPIEWGQWWNRTDLTPIEAAKLLFCIDPVRWDGDDYEQGKIEFELLLKIRKAAALLGNKRSTWSIEGLVDYYGPDDTPHAMQVTVTAARNAQFAETSKKPATTVRAITKTEALRAFASPQNEGTLTTAMENGPKWILPARAAKGARGRGQGESRWHPVVLAIAMHARRMSTVSQLDRVFARTAFLAPWREEWAEHSEGIRL